jgi:hypothetical protein
MERSAKLGLALMASLSPGLGYPQDAVDVRQQDSGIRVEMNQTRPRQAPDTSFGSVLQRHPGGAGAFPDVAKTPTPGGPVPVPYPNTLPAARGAPPVRVEAVRRAPTVPLQQPSLPSRR